MLWDKDDRLADKLFYAFGAAVMVGGMLLFLGAAIVMALTEGFATYSVHPTSMRPVDTYEKAMGYIPEYKKELDSNDIELGVEHKKHEDGRYYVAFPVKVRGYNDLFGKHWNVQDTKCMVFERTAKESLAYLTPPQGLGNRTDCEELEMNTGAQRWMLEEDGSWTATTVEKVEFPEKW